ncbi:MAG: hypothetical protein MPW15_11325 [Candidatus Manganitrophus sp.]|nr:hypothetical protein [Candidatus Manganitrophus sp.]
MTPRTSKRISPSSVTGARSTAAVASRRRRRGGFSSAQEGCARPDRTSSRSSVQTK